MGTTQTNMNAKKHTNKQTLFSIPRDRMGPQILTLLVTDRWKDGQMEGRTDGRTDGQTVGRTN